MAIKVHEGLSHVFSFTLSILIGGFFFVLVLLIALGINEGLVMLGVKYPASKNVLDSGSNLKSYIMILDYIVVGGYITMESLIALVKTYYIGVHHFSALKKKERVK